MCINRSRRWHENAISLRLILTNTLFYLYFFLLLLFYSFVSFAEFFFSSALRLSLCCTLHTLFCRYHIQYDIKYSGHENRPKNLLLKSVTTNVPSQDLILGSYFTNSSNSCSNAMTTAVAVKPNAMTTTIATTASTNVPANVSMDLDQSINVTAIKNMLMATRVPESCV